MRIYGIIGAVIAYIYMVGIIFYACYNAYKYSGPSGHHGNH